MALTARQNCKRFIDSSVVMRPLRHRWLNCWIRTSSRFASADKTCGTILRGVGFSGAELAGARLVLPRIYPTGISVSGYRIALARHDYFNAMTVLQRVTPRVKARSVLLQGMQDDLSAALLRDFWLG